MTSGKYSNFMLLLILCVTVRFAAGNTPLWIFVYISPFIRPSFSFL